MIVAAVAAAAYLGLLVVKIALALREVRQAPRPGAADLSRVTVVQAVLSGDPALGPTLAANVRALPSARFVWMVDDDDAPGMAICRDVRESNPAVRIEIVVVPPPPEGLNPKLFKLERARAACADDVLIVLDDDTRIPAESASALVGRLDRSDLSTALPGSLDDGRWWSALLAQFVNNNAALTYLPLLNLLPPVTINGMAWAMRRDTIAAIGGFGPIARSLTDDLAVATLMRGSGRTIGQTAAPVWVHTTVRDAGHYVRQMHRWFVFAWLLLRAQPATVGALVLLLHGLPPLLLWSLVAAVAIAPSLSAAGLVAGTLAVRAALLVFLHRHIYGRILHRPLLSIVSELLQPWHVVHALLQRTIVWRTRRYRVRADQTFEAAP